MQFYLAPNDKPWNDEAVRGCIKNFFLSSQRKNRQTDDERQKHTNEQRARTRINAVCIYFI